MASLSERLGLVNAGERDEGRRGRLHDRADTSPRRHKCDTAASTGAEGGDREAREPETMFGYGSVSTLVLRSMAGRAKRRRAARKTKIKSKTVLKLPSLNRPKILSDLVSSVFNILETLANLSERWGLVIERWGARRKPPWALA